MAISPYLAVALVLFISDHASKNLYLRPLEGPRPGSLYVKTYRPFSPPGLLYKKVVEPHSTDFNKTPAGSKSARLDRHMITQQYIIRTEKLSAYCWVFTEGKE